MAHPTRPTSPTSPTPPIDSWLNLSMLRLLTGVAEHGSLSASARNAGLAQSNASRAMKTLERRLGYPLLHRSTRGSTLTQEGKLTTEWARQVLEAVDRLAAGAEALAHPGQEELTVAASMTIAEHLLPGWIRSFRQHQPEVSTKLQVMNSAQVLSAVTDRQASLGFVETPTVPAALHSAPVWADRLAVVVGTQHPWAQLSEPLDPATLATTPLVEREPGSGTRAFLDLLVGAHRPAPLLELNSIAMICQAVIEGIGPAVLSRLAVESYLRTGQLVEVPTRGESLTRTLQAVWRKAAPVPDHARAFLTATGIPLNQW